MNSNDLFSRPKFVAFDFDGTLADTNLGIIRTFRETFHRMGIEAPDDVTLSSVIGITLYDGFPLLCPGLPEEKVREAVELYHAIFPEIAFPVVEPFPGIREVLRKIRNNGLRMAILSARSHNSLELLAKQIGVADCFEAIFGAEDVECCKPAPDLALLALKRFGFSGSETLIVGDASYDILMAKAAGCHSCAVTWGNQSRERLLSVEPEFIVDEPVQILDVLGL